MSSTVANPSQPVQPARTGGQPAQPAQPASAKKGIFGRKKAAGATPAAGAGTTTTSTSTTTSTAGTGGTKGGSKKVVPPSTNVPNARMFGVLRAKGTTLPQLEAEAAAFRTKAYLQEDKSRLLMSGTIGQKVTAPAHAIAGTTSRARASVRNALCEVKIGFGDSAGQGLGLRKRKFYQHGILVPEQMGTGSAVSRGQPTQPAVAGVTTTQIATVTSQQAQPLPASTSSATQGPASSASHLVPAAAGGAAVGALGGAALAGGRPSSTASSASQTQQQQALPQQQLQQDRRDEHSGYGQHDASSSASSGFDFPITTAN